MKLYTIVDHEEHVGDLVKDLTNNEGPHKKEICSYHFFATWDEAERIKEFWQSVDDVHYKVIEVEVTGAELNPDFVPREGI